MMCLLYEDLTEEFDEESSSSRPGNLAEVEFPAGVTLDGERTVLLEA